ncbi:MAG: rhomboid family intramembrane serine protease [Planctomycetales bacterium]|nr:rhomboid family intramembrane serine protease [Planctomycetales bacterium]
MFPIHDNIPSQRFPLVNTTIIIVCGLVFLIQLTQLQSDALVLSFGMIPARIGNPSEPIEVIHQIPVQTPYGIQLRTERQQLGPSAVPPWMTLITCIFLHGGWMHILGNMWFLYIFGDNVEDRLGHLGYLIFYLACGVGASAAHMAISPQSTVPTIGASGAIAGVMGAYFILYPRAMVLAVIPIVFILQTVVVPAPLFLAVWFLMQFFQGTMSITSAASAGVAWWAHIGGFAIGCGIAYLLQSNKLTNPPVQERRPGTERIGQFRSFP